MTQIKIPLIVCFLTITFLVLNPCSSSTQKTQLLPPFQASQMTFIDNNGLFLLSNTSVFAFGFIINNPPHDTTSFFLSIIHLSTSTVVWTANGGNPVSQSDNFVFSKDGNAYLQLDGNTIWSTNTSGSGATVMELEDSGNLVMRSGQNSSFAPLWQSFSYPTDTLLSGQSFVEGMKLVSQSNGNNNKLSYGLEIQSGDMVLFGNFRPPQRYWSMQQDNRKIIDKNGGEIHSAVLDSNSWKFLDQNKSLLWQFVAVGSSDSDPNSIWILVLGSDGYMNFYNLQGGGTKVSSSTRIPQDSCSTPEVCGPYYVCNGGRCLCPEVLTPFNCNSSKISSSCSSNSGFELAEVGKGIGYFATNFISPFSKSKNLSSCTSACMANCSCLAAFFDDALSYCFLFDQIGSFQQLQGNGSSLTSYIKISSYGNNGNGSSGGGGGTNKHIAVVLIICFGTLAVILGIIYLAIRVRRQKRWRSPEPSQQVSSEEDNFLDNISGMPVRFSYRELQEATENFNVKLGQGGFGSVYLGKLPNGTQIAVKKLDRIGQGKKEFRAEVTTIGNIHHVHLVRLRGFCAEGTHRLLAYDYMAKGSLDRWIFPNNNEGIQLNWDQRYNIALGTAKGLAYLHEDCDVKIVHCDIKPENVLLDANFVAKVSDFGLAKLMTREQSQVFTTMRGTRGYLAPEWITNYAISEKSDVYSFGMVFLEIIGGRKNFDPGETSEKAHFPTYAFKMMEEGKMKEILDAKLSFQDKEDDIRFETAIKVALWCIQEDLSLRPSMAKVVQMLEGVSYVPQPPNSSQIGFRMYANVFRPISEEGSSSGPSDCNSDALLSAVRLSGPR